MTFFSIPLNMSKPIDIYHSFNTSFSEASKKYKQYSYSRSKYSQFVMDLKILITFHSNVMHHGIGVKLLLKVSLHLNGNDCHSELEYLRG